MQGLTHSQKYGRRVFYSLPFQTKVGRESINLSLKVQDTACNLPSRNLGETNHSIKSAIFYRPNHQRSIEIARAIHHSMTITNNLSSFHFQ